MNKNIVNNSILLNCSFVFGHLLFSAAGVFMGEVLLEAVAVEESAALHMQRYASLLSLCFQDRFIAS